MKIIDKIIKISKGKGEWIENYLISCGIASNIIAIVYILYLLFSSF
jgi:hypothetical protein